MSEPKFYELPVKVAGGVTVRVWFKTYNDGFNWMQEQGLLGKNSTQAVVDAWEEDAKKEIKKEANSLRRRLIKWIKS